MNTITVSRTHYQGNGTYSFKLGRATEMSSIHIALASATIPYSWGNITSTNNTFNIIHPTTAGTTTLNITLPLGGYEVADINSALRTSLVNQGYYIQNNSTQEQVVYAAFRVNASTYQIEFVSYPMPTSLPSGFTAGPSITFPATTKGPQLIVLANGFTTRIGFAAATFPATQPTTITVVGSTTIPLLTDVENVVVSLDTCYNRFAPSQQVLTTLSPNGTAFGKNINYVAPELVWTPQQNTQRDSLTIRLLDQNFRTINLSDPGVVLNLVMKQIN